VLLPPSARMLEAVSVDNDPPGDPLEHRYDHRRAAGARPQPAAPRTAPSPASDPAVSTSRLRDSAPPDAAAHGPASPEQVRQEQVRQEQPHQEQVHQEPPARLPATIEEFLAGLGTRAFRFAELGLRHREDALDAVQDAMMKMLGYRERPPQEWTPLFWSILRSRIVDIQRRRTFRLRWLMPAARDDDDAPMDWADDGPDPSRTHDGREAYGKLADALTKLPRRQREAFSLRILEELDVATTARAMGCSEGAVKTHLSRAREALQRQLEEWR
jgi:RNA polymerase sigma factor (sigma-70 family)